ncbi:MAG: hypothetical protein GEV07_30845 [Streptosporangiales bacterium]|nr:hypothetical protein [Streptosporangiales bacterium]
MPVIGLLVLGVWLAFITVCAVVAARKGLWLKVEYDVHETVAYAVTQHHYFHQVDAMDTDAFAPSSRVVSGRVLARAVLPATPRRHLTHPAHWEGIR